MPLREVGEDSINGFYSFLRVNSRGRFYSSRVFEALIRHVR